MMKILVHGSSKGLFCGPFRVCLFCFNFFNLFKLIIFLNNIFSKFLKIFNIFSKFKKFFYVNRENNNPRKFKVRIYKKSMTTCQGDRVAHLFLAMT